MSPQTHLNSSSFINTVKDFIRVFIGLIFQLPLIFMFVFPFIVIITGIQEAGLENISGLLLLALFFSAEGWKEGAISINSLADLARNIAIFLLCIEVLLLLWRAIKKRFQIKWNDQLLSHIILLALWVGSLVTMGLEFWGINLVLYLAGLLLLSFYQTLNDLFSKN